MSHKIGEQCARILDNTVNRGLKNQSYAVCRHAAFPLLCYAYVGIGCRMVLDNKNAAVIVVVFCMIVKLRGFGTNNSQYTGVCVAVIQIAYAYVVDCGIACGCGDFLNDKWTGFIAEVLNGDNGESLSISGDRAYGTGRVNRVNALFAFGEFKLHTLAALS